MGATSGCVLLLLAACAAVPPSAAIGEMRKQVVVELPFQLTGWCPRLLNATHQFGCGSSMNGNEGVIVVARTRAEVEGASDGWKERFPSYTGGFMLLMDELLLDGETAPLLLSSQRVTGVLLMPTKESIGRDTPLSADAACPNRHSSLYSDWRACGAKPASASTPKSQWNGKGAMMEQGMRFTDWPKPMVRVTNESVLETIIKCHDAYNLPEGKAAGDVPGRLCAVGALKTFELAASNAAECMRRQKQTILAELGIPNRQLCDPLTEYNLFGVFPPGVANKTDSSYLAIVARMDGVAAIPDASPATYGTMTALVAALTAAKVIGDNQATFEAASKASNKRVLFAFLHGESFDYTGSARWVYDMETGAFPARKKADAHEDVPEPISMDKIALAVELQQIDGESHALHAHVDGKNYDVDERGKGKIKKALEKMRGAMADDGYELKEERVNANGVLPPSSLHTLLKRRRQTPSVLVTSFDEQYSNRRFHSLYDRVEGGKAEVERVKKSIAAVSRGVVALMADHVGIDEQSQKELKIDEKWLDMLADCLIATTKIPECDYLRALFDNTDMMIDRSTYISADRRSLVRKVMATLLVLATGEHKSTINVRDKESCKHVNEKQALYEYVWQLDPWAAAPNSSFCYRTSVWAALADSPAFFPDTNGDVHLEHSNYSTWVESQMSINTVYALFLVESQPADWTLICAGLITVLLSILIVGRCDDSSFIVDEGERAAEEGEPL